MGMLDVQFEIGRLRDGGFAMFCNRDIPSQVKQVEYYCDARIFILTFFSLIDGEKDHMIQYEVSSKTASFLEELDDESVLMVASTNFDDVRGYEVPFIKSGMI